jgi:SAM-dependent methyltransferase
MSVFGDYARYYNVLYLDKKYTEETAYILKCLKQCGCSPSTLLDLSCGMGKHALEMAKQGISVTGVDMSKTMLAMGEAYYKGYTENLAALLPTLHYGDARTVRLGQKFDAVTSLFHVMSYQNTEEDALAELCTAKEHLVEGGIFLFDFWYGVGVLTDPPTERDRTMEDAHTFVQRHAQPVHCVNDNIVEVHYAVRLTDKRSGAVSELQEVHSMRYWFLPELRFLAPSRLARCRRRCVDAKFYARNRHMERVDGVTQ